MDNDTTAAVAAEVRAALGRNRVEDGTLADWLNVSRTTANRKKMGRAPLSIAELRTLGQRLDCDFRSWLPDTLAVRSDTAYAVTGRKDVA